MTTGRLAASDVVMRVVSIGLALTGVAMFVAAITMFWGPLRQVLAAPVFMALGVMVYIGGRVAWWIVEQDRRARP
jgi:Na+/melibiose symporter-like transporter